MGFESSISMSPVLFYHITWLLAVMAGAAIADISEVAPKQGTDLLSAAVTTKPGCPRKCGDLTIPYPFGIGPSCSLNPFYSLTCNSTFDPPKAFLIGTQIANFSEIPRSIHEILDISENQFRVRNMVLHNCFNPENITKSKEQGMFLPPDSPFAFSATSNKVIAVGCGFYTKFRERDNSSIDLCSSYCTTKDDVAAGECSGANGCKIDVFRSVVKEFYFMVARPLPNSNSYDQCGYGFMGDATAFKFRGLSDFEDHKVFTERTLETVPLVVDWVIANGQTCKEAQKNAGSYACQNNTSCKDTNSGIGGYHCQCRPEYDGNPYLPPGCTEIVECSFAYERGGSVCVLKSSIRLILGLGISFITLGIGITWIYLTIRKHRLLRLKEKLFTKNGGLLLKKQLSSMDEGGSQPITIFTQKELKMATNNFKDDCIAGRGGSGIVYKGILEDKSLIAIKKAIMVDESQIDQFINELLILSQLNHKNVVKLLGCCLDVEVPLLIYEFVPNGALFNHIHNAVHGSWLNWHHCLRIVYEIGDALAYLHSAANCPVIHRDIKSANILLDENYTAKISDFGGSRLIPLDQTKWATAVQGTLGYLDPEYLFSSQLTEKSDVYSFGVLVAELLTRKKAVYQIKGSEFRNLATDFVELMNIDQVALILEPRMVTEAPIKEIKFLVELVGQCLSAKGEDRPTMKDVVAQLDRLVSRVLSR